MNETKHLCFQQILIQEVLQILEEIRHKNSEILTFFNRKNSVFLLFHYCYGIINIIQSVMIRKANHPTVSRVYDII